MHKAQRANQALCVLDCGITGEHEETAVVSSSQGTLFSASCSCVCARVLLCVRVHVTVRLPALLFCSCAVRAGPWRDVLGPGPRNGSPQPACSSTPAPHRCKVCTITRPLQNQVLSFLGGTRHTNPGRRDSAWTFLVSELVLTCFHFFSLCVSCPTTVDY